MNTNTLDTAFDLQALADDLCEVRRIDARFFAGLAKKGSFTRPK